MQIYFMQNISIKHTRKLSLEIRQLNYSLPRDNHQFLICIQKFI